MTYVFRSFCRILCSIVLFFQRATFRDYRHKVHYFASYLKRLALFEPNITTAFVSMALACSGPFKRVLFEGPLSFVGGALKSLGAPGPVLSTMVLSGGLYASYFPAMAAIHEKNHHAKRSPLSSPILQPQLPILQHEQKQEEEEDEEEERNIKQDQNQEQDQADRNQSSGVSSVMSPFHVDQKGDSENPLTKPWSSASASGDEAIEENDHRRRKVSKKEQTNYFFSFKYLRWSFDKINKWSSGKGKLILLICFLKLVALPSICYPITAWLFNSGILSKKDKLLQMIMFIESAVPSSQSVVSIVQIEAGSKCADRISALYLPMYIASAITLSIAVALAIWVID